MYLTKKFFSQLAIYILKIFTGLLGAIEIIFSFIFFIIKFATRIFFVLSIPVGIFIYYLISQGTRFSKEYLSFAKMISVFKIIRGMAERNELILKGVGFGLCILVIMFVVYTLVYIILILVEDTVGKLRFKTEVAVNNFNGGRRRNRRMSNWRRKKTEAKMMKEYIEHNSNYENKSLENS